MQYLNLHIIGLQYMHFLKMKFLSNMTSKQTLNQLCTVSLNLDIVLHSRANTKLTWGHGTSQVASVARHIGETCSC